MIVLDTTVLVYAVGEKHPLRQPCRSILDAVASGRLTATTTAEVVQEFAHVRARRRGRTDAIRLAAAMTDLLAPLLPLQEVALRDGLALFASSTRLGAFDCVLAAAARTSGADALVSADLAFADVPELRHVLPTDDEVTSLLG